MHQQTTIDLFRHGEVEGGKRYYGSTDVPLSVYGMQQMLQTVNNNNAWNRIISSPLKRCMQFAGQLNTQYSMPLKTDKRFQEIHFGDWEGKSAEELLNHDPEKIQNYWADPVKHSPPKGETLHAFKDRVLQGWNELVETHNGEHLLLVTHAGTIRIILAHVLCMPINTLFRLDVPYACLSRIRINYTDEKRFPSLIFHAGSL